MPLDTVEAPEAAVVYESVPCPLCDAEKAKLAFTSTDIQFGGAEKFQFVKCTECGLYYMNPRPVADCIGRYYPGNYYSYSNAPDKRPLGYSWKPSGPTTQVAVKQALSNQRVGYQIYRMLKLLKSAASRITPGVSQAIRLGSPVSEPGRILDIGCGAGQFLDSMKLAGWETWGIDISDDAARTAASHGHCTMQGDVTKVDLPANHFDAVRLWHTLEHVHEPVRVLEAARKCLKPGGSLIVGVPNVKSLPARWFGRYWMGWDIPRHMWAFSPTTLRRITEKSGYRVTGIWTYSMPIMIGISLAWKRGGMSASLDELSSAARRGCSWGAEILTRMRQGDIICLHAVPLRAESEQIDDCK